MNAKDGTHDAIVVCAVLRRREHRQLECFIVLKIQNSNVDGGWEERELNLMDCCERPRLSTFVSGILWALECDEWALVKGRSCHVELSNYAVARIGNRHSDRWFSPEGEMQHP